MLGDIRLNAALIHPEDDTANNIGGDIDPFRRPQFADFSGLYQVVAAGATAVGDRVRLFYRDVDGNILQEDKFLNGTTIITSNVTLERIMKTDVISANVRDVALESQTAIRENMTRGAGNGYDQIQLDTGASSVDNFYTGKILRLTSGAGVNQLREIVAYKGIDRMATVTYPWTSLPDATTGFRISNGCYFDRRVEFLTLNVVRLFYSPSAPIFGGQPRSYYVKIFLRNAGQLVLSDCVVREAADATGKITFGLDPTINNTLSNGGSRTTAPTGVTFDNADKAVPGGILRPLDRIGVWVKLALTPGDVFENNTWVPQLLASST